VIEKRFQIGRGPLDDPGRAAKKSTAKCYNLGPLYLNWHVPNLMVAEKDRMEKCHHRQRMCGTERRRSIPRRANLKPVVLEWATSPAAQLSADHARGEFSGISPRESMGPELIANMRKQAEKFGADIQNRPGAVSGSGV